MQQPLRLTRTTPVGAKNERFAFNYRWMHAFFTDNRAPGNVKVIELQRRAVWIGLALFCQTLASIPPAFSFSQISQGTWYAIPLEAISSLLPLGLTLGGFVAMWLAIKPTALHQQYDFIRQHGARWQRTALLRTLLLLVAGLVFCELIVVQLFFPPAYSNDGTSLDTNAAQLLLAGKNPYTDSNILDVARRFDIQPTWTTPLRVGQFAGMLDYPSEMDFRSAFDTALKANHAPEFESKVSYPALSFLTLVPIVFLKLGSVVPFYILSYILLVWLAWKAARDELKPWLLLLALANVPMLGEVMGGSLDVLYTLLIVLAWLWCGKRWQSALFLGLAMASKQTVWFFVPFYTILVLRQYGFREACLRLTVAGGVALAINLPFIIWNPAAWMSGVLAPMADPMFPLGVGIVSLSSYHLLPFLPSWLYLGLEASAMVAMGIYYWRICRACPEAAMFLAVVPLFLAWRSLPSYFCSSAFPLFVLMIARHKDDLTPKKTRMANPFGLARKGYSGKSEPLRSGPYLLPMREVRCPLAGVTDPLVLKCRFRCRWDARIFIEPDCAGWYAYALDQMTVLYRNFLSHGFHFPPTRCRCQIISLLLFGLAQSSRSRVKVSASARPADWPMADERARQPSASATGSAV